MIGAHVISMRSYCRKIPVYYSVIVPVVVDLETGIFQTVWTRPVWRRRKTYWKRCWNCQQRHANTLRIQDKDNEGRIFITHSACVFFFFFLFLVNRCLNDGWWILLLAGGGCPAWVRPAVNNQLIRVKRRSDWWRALERGAFVNSVGFIIPPRSDEFSGSRAAAVHDGPSRRSCCGSWLTARDDRKPVGRARKYECRPGRGGEWKKNERERAHVRESVWASGKKHDSRPN